MENILYVICPNPNISQTLDKMIYFSIKNIPYTKITTYDKNLSLKDKRIIFALELNNQGYDLHMLNFLNEIYTQDKSCLDNSTAIILVHSPNELGTKRAAQDIIYMTNNMGCSYMGHPVLECAFNFINFKTWQKVYTDMSLESICYELCHKLSSRLLEFKPSKVKNPKILVLYSTPHKRSNTLDFWNMIKKELTDYDIKEIQIEHGEIHDCKGCMYDACIHFGERNTCFYGGLMVREVLPSIEECDVIVWLCPNYNDALAANLTAAINRLTVLYRKISFYEKSIFGIVVSGNSGSDSIVKQLLGALNINKGFMLPPNFSIHATANDPNAIFDVPNIENIASEFGKHIKKHI